MYTQKTESFFGFPPVKKQTDPDTHGLSWLMDEEGGGTDPYDFLPVASDGSGGYSFESFPTQLPPLGSTFASGFVPPESMFFDGIRRPLDSFGFPTELEAHSQMMHRTQPPFEVQEIADTQQGSTEDSSTVNPRKSTSTPSLAQVKNRKAQKKFRERQKVLDFRQGLRLGCTVLCCSLG